MSVDDSPTSTIKAGETDLVPVFTYGSLLNRASRSLCVAARGLGAAHAFDTCDGEDDEGTPLETHPAILRDYEVCWDMVVNIGRPARYLTIRSKRGRSVVGAIVYIPRTAMPLLAAREKTYNVQMIARDEFVTSATPSLDDTPVVVYTGTNCQEKNPTPVVQSYLDVVMVGALDILGASPANSTVTWAEAYIAQLRASLSGMPLVHDRANPYRCYMGPNGRTLHKVDELLGLYTP